MPKFPFHVELYALRFKLPMLCAGLIGTGMALASCQSTTVNEAKQIATEFKGSQLIVPPRGIQDVIALIRKETAQSRTKFEAWNETAAQIPPSGLKGRDLARFYAKRGEARDLLGHAKHAIADLQKSVEVASQADDANEFDKLAFQANYGFIEARVGNFAKGLEALQNAVISLRKLPASANPFVSGHRNARIAGFEGGYAAFSAIVGNLGNADEALARGRTALSKLQDSLQLAEDNNVILDSETIAGVLAMRSLNLAAEADVARFKGDLKQAERQAAEAIALAVGRKGEVTGFSNEQLGGIDIFAGGIFIEALRAQGRSVEALTHARDLVETAVDVHGRFSGRTFYALRALNNVLLDQARFKDAAELAAVADGLIEEAGADQSSLLAIAIGLQGAQALTGQRRWSEAARTFTNLAQILPQDDGSLRGLLIQDPARGLALLRAGELSAAVTAGAEHAEKMLSIYGPQHYRAVEAEAFRLVAQLSVKASSSDLRQLKDAIGGIFDRRRQRGALTPIDALRLEAIAEIYATQAMLEGGDTNLDLAFRLVEEIRSGELASTVASSAARNFAGTPELAELIRREQDLRQQSDAVFGALNQALSLPRQIRNDEEEARLRAQSQQVLSALEVLSSDIRSQYPNYDELIHPQPPTIAEAQGRLTEDESLLVVFDGEEKSILWAIPGDGSVHVAVTTIGRSDIKRRVDGLRRGLDLAEVRRVGDIPAFDLVAAHDLYREILHPVEAGWHGRSNLIVVAHGALGYLPFGLLPTKPMPDIVDNGLLFSGYRKVNWLAKEHSITSLPSTGSLVILRAQSRAVAAGSLKFLGFGDPLFNAKDAAIAKAAGAVQGQVASRGTVRFRSAPKTRGENSATVANLPRLPETADELRSIATSLKANPLTDVVLGLDANEGRVKSTNFKDIGILAFATHGLAVGDLDGLNQPALAFTPSALAGGNTREDGLLTMGEVLGLKLNADWVVLSACNTGAGDGIGAKAVSGLGRAFFYAGTRGLLVTNWPVETHSAKSLTTGLFERYAANPDIGSGKALQDTIRTMIQGDVRTHPTSGTPLFSYAHPVFWAPFTFVGDGGTAGRPAS